MTGVPITRQGQTRHLRQADVVDSRGLPRHVALVRTHPGEHPGELPHEDRAARQARHRQQAGRRNHPRDVGGALPEAGGGGRADHRAGEGLSVTTVKQVHAILSGAFGEAERNGVIPANPCRHARIPARPSGDQLGHEISVWSPGDLRRFLELTPDERHGCLWRFMAMTGVRRGEGAGAPLGRPRPGLNQPAGVDPQGGHRVERGQGHKPV